MKDAQLAGGRPCNLQTRREVLVAKQRSKTLGIRRSAFETLINYI